MKTLTIIFIALAGLLACQLTSAVRSPSGEAQATVPKRVIKQLPTATPEGGLTMLEAWQRAEPEARDWAPDARLGVKWLCQGQLSEDGRCNGWYGLVGSLSKQEMADLHVKNGAVEFEPLETPQSVIEEVLVASFTPAEFLDSPAVMQRARAWLAAEEMAEADIQNLVIQADTNGLAACGLSSGTAIYILKTRQPSGRLCLDPFSGSVVYDNLR